ncbi:hypothetical protein [Vibrio sp. dhg]|nr:hypothetical protein [Vibrio sp. dhg]CAH0527805.1 hypothetical protein CTH30272_01451 [Catenococcus thiocycli]
MEIVFLCTIDVKIALYEMATSGRHFCTARQKDVSLLANSDTVLNSLI